MRGTALLLALVATTALAQHHKPLRPATDAEKQARAAVVIADYRYGDLLWENDRIAFRIYSPALEKARPDSRYNRPSELASRSLAPADSRIGATRGAAPEREKTRSRSSSPRR